MFFVSAAVLYGLFFVLCVLGTGTDEKNLKSFASYPDKIQGLVRLRPSAAAKIKTKSEGQSFVSNLVLFTVLLLVFSLPVRTGDFMYNFLQLLILGEGLNLFDLLVIDLCWWRNTKRIRFDFIEAEPELYKDPKNHIKAFLRALPLFLLVALLDGFILTLF